MTMTFYLCELLWNILGLELALVPLPQQKKENTKQSRRTPWVEILMNYTKDQTHGQTKHLSPCKENKKKQIDFLYRIYEFFIYSRTVVPAQSPVLHRASIQIAHIEFTPVGQIWNCINRAWHLLIDFPLLWYCWAFFYCYQHFLINSCIVEFLSLSWIFSKKRDLQFHFSQLFKSCQLCPVPAFGNEVPELTFPRRRFW